MKRKRIWEVRDEELKVGDIVTLIGQPPLRVDAERMSRASEVVDYNPPSLHQYYVVCSLQKRDRGTCRGLYIDLLNNKIGGYSDGSNMYMSASLFRKVVQTVPMRHKDRYTMERAVGV